MIRTSIRFTTIFCLAASTAWASASVSAAAGASAPGPSLQQIQQQGQLPIDPTTQRRQKRHRSARRIPIRTTVGAGGEVIGYTTDDLIVHAVGLDDLTAARQDLMNDGHTLVPVASLAPGSLDGLDRLIVGVVNNVLELSPQQVDVIEDFVLAGGTLVFLGENWAFFRNNVAVGGRFGIVYPADFAEASDEQVVTNFPPHPITDGPFGTVSLLDGSANGSTGFGSMLSPGPFGRSIASFADGNSCAVVIEACALGPGSGTVVALSEVNLFLENYFDGDNRAFWRNLFAYGGVTTLDFETEDDFATPLANAQAVQSPSAFGNLVNITGLGAGNHGPAIYDSTPDGPNAGGNDPDLLVGTGNVLILQEHPAQTVPGLFDVPDDAVLGGVLVFDFLQPVQPYCIDLIDVCPGPPLQDVQVTLIDQSGASRWFFVPGGWTGDIDEGGAPGYGTLELMNPALQPGFLANATSTTDAGFDPADVIRMTVNLSSSGAVDNLRFQVFD